MALGSIIRKKREQLGLTLDEVSRQTDYSKPYLSTVETGKVKNPPADTLLIKLEKLLGFEPGSLTHIAHLEKLPVDVRQEFETSKARNDEWRALVQQMAGNGGSIEKLLQSAKTKGMLNGNDSNVDRLQTAGRLVPVINQVAAGYPVDYDDMGYPPGAANDYVRCPDLHDPHAFAVRVIGDSMEPKYRQGDIIIFSPDLEVRSGDDCFIRMTDPHETTFKQVFMEDGQAIRLQPRNQAYPPMTMPRERINGIYRAVIRYERLAD